MAITNASRIADFSSGIGTAGAAIQIDNVNQRVVVGSGASTILEVAGIVSATSFSGHLTGNVTGTASTATSAATAYGLTGIPNITVNNLTVNGTQTIINTTSLEVADKNIGIGSTSTPTDALVDGAGLTIYGTTNKTLTYNDTKKAIETNIAWAPNETRVITGAEKVTRINGNTATLTYNSSSSNIGFCTNPSGDVTLNVVNIPTNSDFDDYALTFAVITTSTGTARTCTTVTLNGVSKSIRWAGGSLSLATAGVTTSNGQTIFTFTGINTVGSASTTDNYIVLGAISGGFF